MVPREAQKSFTLKHGLSKTHLRRVDFLGTALLLLVSILLVAVLEETEVHYQWRSTFAILVLIASGLSWLAFLGWSWKITRANCVREPVLPWRLIENLVCVGLLM